MTHKELKEAYADLMELYQDAFAKVALADKLVGAWYNLRNIMPYISYHIDELSKEMDALARQIKEMG